MPEQPIDRHLSRRERQIMDVLFQMEEATAAEVQERLPEAPSYSAVRAMLRILEDKGHVRHHEDGPRYVYRPVVARDTAQKTAISHMLRTFFDGSVEAAMTALLDATDRRLSRDEVDRLSSLIEERRREGR
ncbi:Penicillinase repressor [Gemmatirosa kalamazoonensis]|uniref:Penicillinase repressor n=1 Tax=Gemmatirosa kalamazoonensis TaxID=861299 RepID=W0REX6_9BACT|nr:BlaI/MecI/CopY family transcriptional regulator [Gemmatirosa kalamazoonensis]AHG88997.1 Penicillinase repressor [Gemmatirosa kalamazoonensis]